MPDDTLPVVLTVAGSDSGGGAGIQADLKTFFACGTHGLSVITALTAQSTREVRGVLAVPADFVRLQLETLFADYTVHAVKTGMLGAPDTVEAVAEHLRGVERVVVDPVLVATTGATLGSPSVLDATVRALFPLSTVVTPNLDEIEALTGQRPETPSALQAAGQRVLEHGARAVLAKGGHLPGAPVDVFLERGREPVWLEGERIDAVTTHGSGCTMASALAASLAQGAPLLSAVRFAHAFIRGALRGARAGVGQGGVLDYSPAEATRGGSVDVFQANS